MRQGKFVCLFIDIKWRPKGSMTLYNVSSSFHKCKKEALGYAYNTYRISYLKSDSNYSIVWNGNPSYSYCRYKFAIIVEANHYNLSVNIKDHWYKIKLRDWLDEMFKDWFKPFGSKKIYEDNSIQMSRYSWQTTIPKGYKLVRPGTKILKTDLEFTKDQCSPNFWIQPSWYNIGKLVEKGQGMKWIGKNKKVYKREPGYITPLIIRKIK